MIGILFSVASVRREMIPGNNGFPALFLPLSEHQHYDHYNTRQANQARKPHTNEPSRVRNRISMTSNTVPRSRSYILCTSGYDFSISVSCFGCTAVSGGGGRSTSGDVRRSRSCSARWCTSTCEVRISVGGFACTVISSAGGRTTSGDAGRTRVSGSDRDVWGLKKTTVSPTVRMLFSGLRLVGLVL